MKRALHILFAIGVLLASAAILNGGLIGLSANPFTWLAFLVCALVSFFGVWYGSAIILGIDWE